MLEKDFCTPRQAARILGRSPSTISRALAQGRLSYIDPEKKLLLRAGLEQRFANATRRKADCPQKAERDDNAAARVALIPDPPSPPEIATDYWSRLDQKLSFSLGAGPVYWQQPSDPQRLRLFCRTLDELRSQVEMEDLVDR